MANVEMTGQATYKQYHNSDWGAPELDDGHAGHVGLVSAYKVCTTAADTIVTVTTGKKGYVTFFSAYNTHTAAQTLTLADTDGTKLMLSIGSLETVTWIAGKEPFLELATGAVTGDAGTATGVNVTMSYYEK